jgi:Zn ribbon nucleic-acid-binding protein
VQVNIFVPEADEYIECTQCDHSERRPDSDEVSAKNHLEDQLARDAMPTGTRGTVKFKP